ncbi:MAG: enoyl-CoA hydratase/isomerase family protein [Polaromonas sp.]|nr:enoyl-CoA hydratase/isomerase family protein [Polaromonas sp.]MDP3172424.1 enoyl-CoA hydratase/isomerase family protein [Polaromonas sp.]
MEVDNGQVLIEKAEGLATITLCRPGKLNALSPAMRAALGEHLGDAARDDAIRVVLIRAQGSDFCAGADLMDAPDAPLVWRDRIRIAQAHHLSIVRMKKPVIAAVQGRAVGGGASLALAADILILADDAKLVFPFVKLGVVPDGGASALLQAKAGAAASLDLLLTAGALDAAEARQLGLTRRVVAAAQLDSASIALAHALLKLPWEALMLTKALCAQQWAHGLESVLAHESDAFALATSTHGHRQAMAAMRESLGRQKERDAMNGKNTGAAQR